MFNIDYEKEERDAYISFITKMLRQLDTKKLRSILNAVIDTMDKK